MAKALKPRFNAALLLRDAKAIGMDFGALVRVSGKSRWTLGRFLDGSIQTTKSNEAFAWAVRQSPERYVIGRSIALRAQSKTSTVQSRRRVIQRKGRVS